MAVTECLDVGKSKGRPKTGRQDVTVKVDGAVISKAKLVASARNIPLAEFVSDLLRVPVDREFAKEMKRVQEGGS